MGFAVNILFLDWDCYGKEDIIDTFKELNHSIDIMKLELATHTNIDYKFHERLIAAIQKGSYEIVFTLNFYPTVSSACNNTAAKYISWIYDSPFVKLYSASIINKCNYIFIFDKATYNELAAKGIETIYYMPLAVNPKRLRNIKISQSDIDSYGCDISFVGSLYNENHNLYDRLTDKLREKNDEYTIGFLEGLIQSQLQIYGCSILDDSISDDILENMKNALTYKIEADSFATLKYVYNNYFLCRKITSIERLSIIERLSEHFNMYLFTYNKTAAIGNAVNKGPVDFYFDMPKVFRLSKINLNITLRSIQTGIPLRAMDIMGCSGFLLSNYQADFFDYFEPDKDFVYYSSTDELIDKADYYLKHDKERESIALNGYNRVCKDHNYSVKLQEMIKIAFS